MNDNEMYSLIQEFANDHSLAREIVVEVTQCHRSFKPKSVISGARYEDASLLSDIIMGAEHFSLWLRRNGYEIKATKKESNKKVLRRAR